MRPRLIAISLAAVTISGYGCADDSTAENDRWSFTTENGVFIEESFSLEAGEEVFAYSRISPDGRYLAYTSDELDRQRTQKLVDLSNGRNVFSESGYDGYFSPSGDQLIFLSFNRGITIRHADGKVIGDIAPVSIGDYFSWSLADGRDLILTIRGNFFYLQDDIAEMPYDSVTACPGIGVGARPLISKDGELISVFVRGTVVVRSFFDCSVVFDTGLSGGKADFSFDNRYVAMHLLKNAGAGYDIVVVDLAGRTMRNITLDLQGSSLFPSWTRDGRLSFQYDSDEFSGFVIATNVLAAPEAILPSQSQQLPSQRYWQDIFRDSVLPEHALNLVLVWAPWGAHSPEALAAAQQAQDYFMSEQLDVGVFTAVDPASNIADVTRHLEQANIELKQMSISPDLLSLTEINNQNPSILMFWNGILISRQLGAQTFEELVAWVDAESSRIGK